MEMDGFTKWAIWSITKNKYTLSHTLHSCIGLWICLCFRDWDYVIDDEKDMVPLIFSLSFLFFVCIHSVFHSYFRSLLKVYGSLYLICIATCVHTIESFTQIFGVCASSEENSCQIEREIKTLWKRTVKFFHTVIIYAHIIPSSHPSSIRWTALENTLLSNAMVLLLRNK